MLNLDQIKIAVKIATNNAAMRGADYWVVGFASFGLVVYDAQGRVTIR